MTDSTDTRYRGLIADFGGVLSTSFEEALASTLGVDPDGLLERMVADLRLEPKVTDAVAELRQRGVRVDGQVELVGITSL
jgi:hypothetical protein